MFFFFFQHFKYFMPLTPCLSGVWREVSCNSYPCSSIVIVPIPCCDFLHDFVFGFVQFEYNMQYFGLYSPRFFLNFWICGLVFLINFRKLSVIITSSISFLYFFFSLFYSKYTYVTHLKTYPTDLECSVLF